MTIALITGGSRGIGAATALACARRGMGIILTYNSNPDSAAGVVDRITDTGATAVALELDVSDTASFAAFAHDVRGTLDATRRRERL